MLLTIERLWAVIKAPKFQRLVVAAFFTVVLSVLFWRNFLSLFIAENQAAWEAISAESGAKHGNIFGSNKRVNFPGMIQVRTMNPDFLPQSSKSSKDSTGRDKRLIFVGDIHGCMTELEALLAKVKYSSDKDHIIAVGDVINKGPKSVEVVDFLMRERASCVRGNHEDRILLVAKDLTGNSLIAQSVNGKDEGREETKAEKRSRLERELAKSFSQEQLDWLNDCPVILKVGELGSHGEIVVVHGGLVPGIRLEDQDPMSVMNTRIVDLVSHVPSPKADQEGSVPWADFWNKYQKLMPAQRTIFGHKNSGPSFKHTTVIYGHDAKRGLQIDTYTKGLDSGCVKGGKLTAWVVSDYGQNRIVQVSCNGYSEEN